MKILALFVLPFLVVTDLCFGDSSVGCSIFDQASVELTYKIIVMEGQKNYRKTYYLCKSSPNSSYLVVLEFSADAIGFETIEDITKLNFKETHYLESKVKTDVWFRRVDSEKYESINAHLDDVFSKNFLDNDSPAVDEKSVCFVRQSDGKRVCSVISARLLDSDNLANVRKIEEDLHLLFPSANKSLYKSTENKYFRRKK